MDENGNEVEETCSEGDFLTPVFFKRNVLKKYYDSPSKYSVGARYLRCLDLWGLPIDTNQKGLVYVWLGDLGDIPYKEQEYWRQHNIPPEGGITEHRWKTDFLSEVADPDEPVFVFHRVYARAQERFRSAFGFPLFLELSAEDSHCYSTLHVPVTNEQQELEEQIQSLAKIVNDSLNLRCLDSKAEKPIHALESFLRSKVGDQEAGELVGPLRMVQNLRSSGVAHRKGQKYAKYVTRYGLEGRSNQDKFIVLLKAITTSLQKLSVV